MKYTLNDSEQRLAEYVTKQRLAYNKKTNATPTVYTDESLYMNNLHSYGAEIAFCKLHNVFPDTDWNIRHMEDAVVQGSTVDVKHTKRTGGNLFVKKMNRRDGYPDYYAQMVGKFPTYEFKGFISRERMIQEERVRKFHKNGFHSQSYVAEQAELTLDITEA